MDNFLKLWTLRTLRIHNIMLMIKCSTLTNSISTEPFLITLTSSSFSSVVAGDIVILNCSVALPTGVASTPDFHWVGPGVTPTPADPTNNGQEVSSVLTLTNISTSQAGRYTCIATLNGSCLTNTTTVTVQS